MANIKVSTKSFKYTDGPTKEMWAIEIHAGMDEDPEVVMKKAMCRVLALKTAAVEAPAGD